MVNIRWDNDTFPMFIFGFFLGGAVFFKEMKNEGNALFLLFGVAALVACSLICIAIAPFTLVLGSLAAIEY